MTYPTHQLTGVVISLAYMKHTGDITLYPLLVSSISSLIPDIDEPHSRAGRKIPILSQLIKTIFGHRNGMTHSFFAMALFSTIFYVILNSLKTEPSLSLLLTTHFILGYSGHLLMDIITKSGIPLLWPIKKQKISIGQIKIKSKKIGPHKYKPGWGERITQLILLITLIYLSHELIAYNLKDLIEIIKINGKNFNW